MITHDLEQVYEHHNPLQIQNDSKQSCDSTFKATLSITGRRLMIDFATAFEPFKWTKSFILDFWDLSIVQQML